MKKKIVKSKIKTNKISIKDNSFDIREPPNQLAMVAQVSEFTTMQD